jgi:hypothetical protein
MWETVAGWIVAIPASFWGVIFGGAITLAGVAYADRNNTKRLGLQLKHDADEKRKQRVVDIRRSIYLDLAKEMAKANAHLSALPSLPLDEDAGQGIVGMLTSAAQVQVVCEEQTAVLVSDLVGMYVEMLFLLIERAKRIRVLIQRIKSLQTRIDAQKTEDEELAQMMKERDAHVEERDRLHIEYVASLVKTITPLAKQIFEVLVAARHELEVTGSRAVFLKLADARAKQMDQLIAKALAGDIEGKHGVSNSIPVESGS